MTVPIVRQDHMLSQLRAEAARSKDAAYARRVLALALVLDGIARKATAETCGMDRQTLRDWVLRYIAEGLAGLCNRLHIDGPAGKLTDAQTIELPGWVRSGPQPGGEQDRAMTAEGFAASNRHRFPGEDARTQHWQAWNTLIATPAAIRSIATRDCAKTVNT